MLRSKTLRAVAVFATLAVAFGLHAGCSSNRATTGSGRQVIVLGFDGMDYGLAREFMATGVMPNFARLAREGQFTPLGTSVPPLSPVAWSNFITGMDAGGHGVFDFIHRDPEKLIPGFSTAKAESSEPTKLWGCWQIPGSGSLENLRRGTPFWEVLERHGVETTVIRMPANYPPSGTASHELSGMGTPDVLGTPGTFSFYTSELFAFGGQDISGGEIYEAWPEDGVVRTTLYGPENPFRSDKDGCKARKLELDFEVYLDPDEEVAKLVIGDEEMVLQVKEWSDWVPVTFEMIPTQTLSGMVRFYLRQVRPEFELYSSPINIDPMNPAFPISTPDDFAGELAEAGGLFYTQGMPEDTKTYTGDVFSGEDFLSQAKIAGDEIAEHFPHVLDTFLKDSGDRFLFYYFGNLDQVSHVMYRPTDPEHPVYDPERDPAFAKVIEGLYRKADEIVGHTLEALGDDARLIIMSDHGFASWRRTFNLNTWLKDNGYLVLTNPNATNEFLTAVDWSKTRAFGVGFNGLYVNLRGRERKGIVARDERDELLAEIGSKLLETVDPATGMPAVTKFYRSDEFFKNHGALDVGPDAIVGYAKGVRAANETVLGEVQAEVFYDNTEPWSGDHGMDHETVPGILLTDAPLKKPATALDNLAVSILAEYGIEEAFPAPESEG